MKRRVTQQEALRFARRCHAGTPEGRAAYKEFSRMLRRAISEGQVGFESRIAELWPLVKEVNDEIDEMEAEHEQDEQGDEPALLAAEFRSHCLTLADAIICVIRHPNCPAYVYNALGDAIAEMSNEQHESAADEEQMIHRVCERAAA